MMAEAHTQSREERLAAIQQALALAGIDWEALVTLLGELTGHDPIVAQWLEELVDDPR